MYNVITSSTLEETKHNLAFWGIFVLSYGYFFVIGGVVGALWYFHIIVNFLMLKADGACLARPNTWVAFAPFRRHHNLMVVTSLSLSS